MNTSSMSENVYMHLIKKIKTKQAMMNLPRRGWKCVISHLRILRRMITQGKNYSPKSANLPLDTTSMLTNYIKAEDKKLYHLNTWIWQWNFQWNNKKKSFLTANTSKWSKKKEKILIPTVKRGAVFPPQSLETLSGFHEILGDETLPSSVKELNPGCD